MEPPWILRGFSMIWKERVDVDDLLFRVLMWSVVSEAFGQRRGCVTDASIWEASTVGVERHARWTVPH